MPGPIWGPQVRSPLGGPGWAQQLSRPHLPGAFCLPLLRSLQPLRKELQTKPYSWSQPLRGPRTGVIWGLHTQLVSCLHTPKAFWFPQRPRFPAPVSLKTPSLVVRRQ